MICSMVGAVAVVGNADDMLVQQSAAFLNLRPSHRFLNTNNIPINCLVSVQLHRVLLQVLIHQYSSSTGSFLASMGGLV